jgi:hypothetical protein
MDWSIRSILDKSSELGLPVAFESATFIGSGLLALVKRIVQARITAERLLFVYPDSTLDHFKPAGLRSHPKLICMDRADGARTVKGDT